MKVLVTGSKGFMAKNLLAELHNIREGKAKGYELPSEIEVFEFDLHTNPLLLEGYCAEADFVFHLAGVNRPQNPGEFMEGNADFTASLLQALKKHGNTCPVLVSSSIQAALDNPYGESKRAGEDWVFKHAEETGAEVLVYRFPNVFGKWSRPNYNSAVATFCYNIARDLPIQVNDPSVQMHLVYIDDVVRELLAALGGKPHREGAFCTVPVVHSITLGGIVDLLYSFRESRKSLVLPDMSEGFTKSLYATYLSFLPEEGFAYPLKMNVDARGSFTEFVKSPQNGQVSINVSKPGITKGEHWHHTKNEKFLVVSGRGIIRFRKIGSEEVISYEVSGEKLEVVDIPVGYTHNIENLGDTDMVTVMWVNEWFNPERPDTFFELVNQIKE